MVNLSLVLHLGTAQCLALYPLYERLGKFMIFGHRYGSANLLHSLIACRSRKSELVLMKSPPMHVTRDCQPLSIF